MKKESLKLTAPRIKNIVKKILEPSEEEKQKIESNVFDTRSFLPLRRMVTTDYYWKLENKKDYQLTFVAKDWITDEIVYTLILYLDYDIDETKEETNSYVFLYNNNGKKVFQSIFINREQEQVGKAMSNLMKKPDFWAGKPDKIFR